ncbi:flagellin N-terminal helical domain-containing protein [Alkalicoccobacillus gibsonii]|uniref:flagellin N-terminal helical domain-containing protein n=1 Tax=Alkalicoccobacillus gibsonii TaxID=79881 RepID=UPI0019336A25|nr:flagellin [Alkalicoccobacillus gibsonii]MBM0064408.1 flagellin [Alkalicoccobacillus gibsonii]
MKINNNIQALNAYRNLSQNQIHTSKNLEKLSSGLRINRAADDAAGLAISEKMRSQIRGLDMAERNALDGVSLMQTAEGAMQEVHSMLQRMRELAVQAANDTNDEFDREQIQAEIVELRTEITSISEKTEFNSKTLLDGTLQNIKFQIGPNADQSVEFSIPEINSTTLGINDISVIASTEPPLSGNAAAEKAIEALDKAIETVSKNRSTLGAIQNRLEHTINNLQVTKENLTSSESRIRDADMALEMTEFTRNNILNQSATAMLAQANQLPQGVLQLLQ